MVAASVAVCTAAAWAAPTPEQKCQADKNKAAGNYAFCRQKAEAKLATTGDVTDYTERINRCETKFATKWAILEQRAVNAGTTCPSTSVDRQVIQGIVTHPQFAWIPKVLAGGTRFVDNGDGTVTDNATGLMWEKRQNYDSIANFIDPHDADNAYTWTAGGIGAADGTVFTDFLPKLNQSGLCFTGQCDWRLPTIAELRTIVLNPCSAAPCIDPTFGPSPNGFYWSSTQAPWPFTGSFVWGVDFNGGITFTNPKNNPVFGRAVRGGL
jgi:hypothetical protein